MFVIAGTRGVAGAGWGLGCLRDAAGEGGLWPGLPSEAEAPLQWGRHTWGRHKERLRAAPLLSLGTWGDHGDSPDWPPVPPVNRRGLVWTPRAPASPSPAVGLAVAVALSGRVSLSVSSNSHTYPGLRKG